MSKPTVSDLDRHIGLRLKKLRQQANVSAAVLAEAIGSTQQQISRYENAQNKLSASQIYLLSQSLGVPLSWFFLECDVEIMPLVVQESRAHYQRNLEDELTLVQSLWPRLSSRQRLTVLSLLDVLLEES